MGRRLTIIILAAIVMIAVMPVAAQNFNWTGGVSITEMASQSGIFSHIDMAYRGRVIGSWFSTAGFLPVLVSSNTISYTAYGDFPGFRKIEKVILTPDGGKTVWPATLVPGKGWQVQIPFGTRTQLIQTVKDVRVRNHKTEKVVVEELKTIIGLEPGGYSAEWRVQSHDKRNKVVIVVIPINYSSTRTTSAANHMMVARETADISCLNDQAIGVYLREHGFQPATDTFSPAVMAAQQMGQQQLPQYQQQPNEREQARDCGSDGKIRMEITGQSKRTDVPETCTVYLHFWSKDGKTRITWKNQIVPKDWYDALCRDTQCVNITRCGEVIATGEAKAIPGGIEIRLYRGSLPEPGDVIETIDEEE